MNQHSPTKMNTDFPRTIVMDPGSPAPKSIQVTRRRQSKNLSRARSIGGTLTDKWVSQSSFPDSPDTLEQFALQFGVALQSIEIRGRDAKCMIRVPFDRQRDAECFLRTTMDGWKTFEDLEAKPYGSSSPVFKNTVCYDCHIALPQDSDTGVEFAICYKNGGHEHWDNNSHQNHHIVFQRQ